MSNIEAISLVILCLSLDFSIQLAHFKPQSISGDTDWDILIFTQHWPATVCKVWTHSNPSHKCIFPKQKDTWTIHGSWPTKLGKMGPENCNGTWLFDPEQVRPIENELEENWIDIEEGRGLYNLWSHEWTKHGTCAASLEPMNNEFKYFSKGLEFLKLYSMTVILGEANILPSNSQPVTIEQLNQAILSNTGKKPIIHCQYEDHIQYLFELRVCLDKQLNLIDCDMAVHLFKNVRNVNGSLTNCNVNAHIIYPEQDPPKLELVHLYKLAHWLQWFTL